MPKWFNVKAQEGGEKSAEVSIRGLIGEWGVTDRDLIAEVEALGDIDNLTVRINSRGGEVDHGVGIFNFLNDHPAHVHVIVEGVAMSCGSLIAMAGDKITMKANAVMMIHNPWTFAAGNAKQLRAQADILEKFESALASVYVSRTGKTEEEVKAMLEGPDGDGIYMTAAEAKAEGFADDIEPVAKKGASAMAMACALGIPEEVLARIEAEEADPEPENEPEPEDDHPLDADETVTAQMNAAIVAAGFGDMAGVWLLDDKINTVEAVQAALVEAREIRDLCVAAKRPDESAKLIKARASLADARKHLTDILAERDEETHTDGHPPSKNSKPAKTAQPAALKTADVWAARRNIH